jgi:hypothetical protein
VVLRGYLNDMLLLLPAPVPGQDGVRPLSRRRAPAVTREQQLAQVVAEFRVGESQQPGATDAPLQFCNILLKISLFDMFLLPHYSTPVIKLQFPCNQVVHFLLHNLLPENR